ncbi:hypothetical protein VNI00_004806 [Paramarasmius palmivorus]|uniref:Thiaminase-2/PQQC domain-containing protein n=1 Tax=Paramarasmius palmivorus TaxID=297713 RepID=A0AAW0DEZ2_9AGAR
MTALTSKANIKSSREGFTLFSIYEDGVLAKRGQGADHVYQAVFEEEQPTPDVVISRFWNDPRNQGIIDAFMNNQLCIDAAQGKPEAIEAYKRYAVQDYFYLLDWFKFRVLRLATLPHDDFELDSLGTELDSVHRSLNNFVKWWYETCIAPESDGGLGMDPEDFQVERSIGAIAYGQYLQNNARQVDWYNLHIILIGCYWAWSKLGVKLYNDPSTNRDTIFYKTWIAPNVDTSSGTADLTRSAKALSQFLDDNAAANVSAVSDAEAHEIFRAALRLEVGLFNSAYDTPVPRPGRVPTLPDWLPTGPGPVQRSRLQISWEKLLGLKADETDEKF